MYSRAEQNDTHQPVAGHSPAFSRHSPGHLFHRNNPAYRSRVQPVFDSLDDGNLAVVTSPVTLLECLVHPYRFQKWDVITQFRELIVNGDNVTFVLTDQFIAERASQLRAEYNLTLPDAVQAATALSVSCDAFLTNDPILKRVAELNVLVLDDWDTG